VIKCWPWVNTSTGFLHTQNERRKKLTSEENSLTRRSRCGSSGIFSCGQVKICVNTSDRLTNTITHLARAQAMMEEAQSPMQEGDVTSPADQHDTPSSPAAAEAPLPAAAPPVGPSSPPPALVGEAAGKAESPVAVPVGVGAVGVPPGATNDEEGHAIVRTISVAGGVQHPVPGGSDSPSPTAGYPSKAPHGSGGDAAKAPPAAASKQPASKTAADALAPATVGGSGLLKTLDSVASWGFGAFTRSLEVMLRTPADSPALVRQFEFVSVCCFQCIVAL
jgi:hypothetical protein